MAEVWKPIPGFVGYEVSDCGRVRSYRQRRVGGLCEKPHALSPSPDNQGYLRVSLRRDGKTYCCRIASLVLLAFAGPRPAGMEACHNNSERRDNRFENLRYDTHAGNMFDRHKLSRLQIIRARHRRANGEKCEALACEYGICQGYMAEICSGRAYASVPGPLTGWRGASRVVKVLRIRRERACGATLSDLALKYGYAISSVSRICCGQTYREIGGPRTSGWVSSR